MRPVRFIPFVLLFSALSCGPGGEKGGPSFLLVTVDTLRRDAVGCYGNPLARTPVIDRLAGEGVLFADAQVSAPLTLPSHATIMTGLYPAGHGARYNARILKEGPATLASLLRDRGYETAGFVASKVLGREYGMARGFDVYGDTWSREDSREGLHGDAERFGHSVVDSFRVWFDGRDHSRPFFAWVHFYDPHAPYEPPAPFGGTADDPYADEVAYTDQLIGRLCRALEGEGIFDDALVMVVSDHGEGLGDHGESEHGVLLHETTVAIPWIVRLPGGGGGRVVRSPVETIDLLPTVAGLLGLSPDPLWQGQDLRPVLEGGEEDAGSRARYAEASYGRYAYGWAPLYAFREDQWKLVRGTRDELFDLEADPGEARDIAAREPERAKRLGAVLDERIAGAALFEDDEEDLSREEIDMLRSLGYLASADETAGEELDPRDMNRAHELTMRGFRLAKEGAVDEAAPLLREALDIAGGNVEAMVWLSFCYRTRGEKEKEEEMYRAILARDPSHAQAWNHLGTLFEAAEEHDSALICFDRAIEGDPSRTDALVNRGTIRFGNGNREGAEEDFRLALRHDSRFAPAHFGMAQVHAERMEMEKLIRALQLTIRYEPTHAEARRWLLELSQRRVDLLYGEDQSP